MPTGIGAPVCPLSHRLEQAQSPVRSHALMASYQTASWAYVRIQRTPGGKLLSLDTTLEKSSFRTGYMPYITRLRDVGFSGLWSSPWVLRWHYGAMSRSSGVDFKGPVDTCDGLISLKWYGSLSNGKNTPCGFPITSHIILKHAVGSALALKHLTSCLYSSLNLVFQNLLLVGIHPQGLKTALAKEIHAWHVSVRLRGHFNGV